jgi:hypothetical protein
MSEFYSLEYPYDECFSFYRISVVKTIVLAPIASDILCFFSLKKQRYKQAGNSS